MTLSVLGALQSSGFPPPSPSPSLSPSPTGGYGFVTSSCAFFLSGLGDRGSGEETCAKLEDNKTKASHSIQQQYPSYTGITQESNLLDNLKQLVWQPYISLATSAQSWLQQEEELDHNSCIISSEYVLLAQSDWKIIQGYEEWLWFDSIINLVRYRALNNIQAFPHWISNLNSQP